MRKRYFTSYKKLSIVILLIFTLSAVAKKKAKDTNIVCFAAKGKWICAPEDRQHIADVKAKNIVAKEPSTLTTSDVIIKTITRPKFEIKKPTTNEQSQALTQNSTASNNHAYANLWSHQLIGVSTYQAAINYVKKKKLDKQEVMIVKSVRANMDWWIVLYGLYKDRGTGINNGNSLPANIDKPWLRSLKKLAVHGFIEDF